MAGSGAGVDGSDGSKLACLGEHRMKKAQIPPGDRSRSRRHRYNEEERSARDADLSDFHLRSHRYGGAGPRHSNRPLLYALRQYHEHGPREVDCGARRHRRGAALFFRHGRDHDFDSRAGQGGRPHRGTARHLRRSASSSSRCGCRSWELRPLLSIPTTSRSTSGRSVRTQSSCISSRRRILRCGSSIWRRSRRSRASTI